MENLDRVDERELFLNKMFLLQWAVGRGLRSWKEARTDQKKSDK